jgi:predicted negative regulator of RcsB-dependent stress response
MKEDRFSKVTLETWARIADWSTTHRSAAIGALVVLLVIVGAALGGWYYLDQQDQAASMALNQAVRTMNTAIRPAGMPPQPEYPSFGSLQERATEAHKQLQAIIAQSPHTRSAKFARYFLGVTAVDLGNITEAENELSEVAKSSNDDLSALAKFALASVYRNHNRVQDAINLYQQLINNPTHSVGKATAQLELAATYEENNRPMDAKKIYQEVQKDNPSTPAGQMAVARLQALK